MPSVPDSASTAHASVAAGLHAYQQGDYATTIARLEPIASALNAQAHMALTIAYARTGQPHRAIAVCQSLAQSPSPQLRDWAAGTLAKLRDRHPPLEDPQPGARDPNPTTEVEGDVTGFVPFESLPESDAPIAPPVQPPVTPDRKTDRLTAAKTTNRTATPRSTRQAPERSPQRALEIAEPEPSDYQPVWKQAGRAKFGQSLGPVKWLPLLVAQVVTAIVLIWCIHTGIYWLMETGSSAIATVFFQGRRTLFGPPTIQILVTLGLLFFTSRWLLDALLRLAYGLRPLTLETLATHSPEASQLLRTECSKRWRPMPALGVLPTTEPIALTYGLPYLTRIVVSQGLLEQLAEDEIATVYASEIGHLRDWTVPLLSFVMVLLQLPYTLYWLAAEWGDRKQSPISRFSATLIAKLSYGLYRVVRGLGLWVARQRLYSSDRAAAELTKNPNGYTRALLKSAIGIAKAVKGQGKTSYLLEGFDLLLPIGHQQATTIGSLYPHTPLEPMLQWDWHSPYRSWLGLNQAHPPLGDRLYCLNRYARQWKLEPELNFAAAQRPNNPALTSEQWRSLLLSGAPWFGLAIGVALFYLLTLLGWIAYNRGLPQLSWMYRSESLRWGLALIGFSLGTLLRLNWFFPELEAARSATLPGLLKEFPSDAIAPHPVRLEGRLIGRPGIGNSWSQDLLLKTATGLARLHCVSRWGNLATPAPRLIDLLNQSITVTGWFRRGATAWIDVETLRTSGGRIHRSDHPSWSATIAILTALWGVFTIAFSSR